MVQRGRRPGWHDAGDLLARAMMHVVCRGGAGADHEVGVGTKLTSNALRADVRFGQLWHQAPYRKF